MGEHVLVIPVAGELAALHAKLSGPVGAYGLNGFGGKIESGESPIAAACREVMEELGTVPAAGGMAVAGWIDADGFHRGDPGMTTVREWRVWCFSWRLPEPVAFGGTLGSLAVWVTAGEAHMSEHLRAGADFIGRVVDACLGCEPAQEVPRG